MSFYEYSSDYSPAMPVCEIYLGSVGDVVFGVQGLPCGNKISFQG